MFEEYLISYGITSWTHPEKAPSGKRKNPDYFVPFGNSELVFEVKEFGGPFLDPGRIDPKPYGPIREKINVARKQFGEYEDRSCSLVLANPKGATIGIDDRLTMLGAMLGEPGFQFRLGVRPSDENPIENVFLGGGKMIHRGNAQNTTISSIIALVRLHRINYVRVAVARDLRRVWAVV